MSSLALDVSTGFGLPPIVSGLDGNLPGPVVAGEEVVLEVGNVALNDVAGIDVVDGVDLHDLDIDVVGVVDIHDEGIVLEDIIHDVRGGADLMVEDRVPAFAFFFHLPDDEVQLVADETVGEDEIVGEDFEAGT